MVRKMKRRRLRRPISASAPSLRSGVPKCRIKRPSATLLSRLKNSHRPGGAYESDLAWDQALSSSADIKRELDSLRSSTSEARLRAVRQERQHRAEVRRQRKEKKDLLEMKRARAARKLAKPKPSLLHALRPKSDDTGGLEGKELKNWKARMEVHTKIVSKASRRTTSKLGLHVRRKRKEKIDKRKKRWQDATPEDGGLTPNPLYRPRSCRARGT